MTRSISVRLMLTSASSIEVMAAKYMANIKASLAGVKLFRFFLVSLTSLSTVGTWRTLTIGSTFS